MLNEEQQEALDKLSGIIAAKRKEAIDARKASGIEAIWLACEEAYLGIDDANRHEFAGARWAKPTSMQGNVTSENTYRTNDGKSTAFIRLTSRYVDAGAAKLAEILLPVDEKAFSFSATPIPDLINDKEDYRPAIGPDGQPLAAKPEAPAPMGSAQPAMPQQAAPAVPQMPQPAAAPVGQPSPMVGASAPAGQPPQGAEAVPAPKVVTIADLAKQLSETAEDSAKRAEKRIYDWMVESGYHAENRKVIHDSARIGVGILKGPFPDVVRKQSVSKLDGGIEIKFLKKVKPSYKWIDAWNLFPDGACGEDIGNGDHIFERDFLAQRQLKELKRQPGYIKSQIDKVVKEGPEKCNEESQNPNEKAHKNRFQVWYFYGSLTRKEIGIANGGDLSALKGIADDIDEVYVIVTMVNDSILRAVLNPLESGKFPYHAMPWSRRAGHWAGVGVGEQVSTPQRIVNAATRALLNNGGNSCGPQIVIDRTAIEPAQTGDWTIRPNKIWFMNPEAVIKDVRAAFAAFEIPNVGDQMQKIIEMGKRDAEEASNIPLISQGQTGPTTPETLGATQLQNNNANTLLRDIGYTYDDRVTEPVVQASYEYLLLDPDVPNDEKGDWDINAHGSTAMVERAIQDQTLAQMGQMVVNPIFGLDPKKWMEEWLKSKRLDPRKMQYTEEEQAKMAQTPPPEDPTVTAAKINAASREKIAGLDQQGAQQAGAAPVAPDNSLEVAKLKADAELERERLKQASADADRDAKYAEADRQRAHDLEMKKMDLEIESMKLQAAQQANLDTAKTDLATTTINDQTKRDLAQQETELAVTLDAAGKEHDVRMNPPSLVRDEVSTDSTP